jgi:hypothetical protein
MAKETKITCDHCGKSADDFERSDGYFDGSEVKITYGLWGRYVAEYEKESYKNLKVDLCPACTKKLKELIEAFLNKKD